MLKHSKSVAKQVAKKQLQIDIKGPVRRNENLIEGVLSVDGRDCTFFGNYISIQPS